MLSRVDFFGEVARLVTYYRQNGTVHFHFDLSSTTAVHQVSQKGTLTSKQTGAPVFAYPATDGSNIVLSGAAGTYQRAQLICAASPE